MKLFFDGQIQDDHSLDNYRVKANKSEFDVVADKHDKTIVLKGGFATEAEANDYINAIGAKMLENELVDIIDVR